MAIPASLKAARSSVLALAAALFLAAPASAQNAYPTFNIANMPPLVINQWGGAALGAATAWGTAPTGNVQGVNANVLSLPPLAAGSNPIGAVTQAGGPWSVSGFDSGPVGPASAATPAASAHSAGQSVGGLFTIPAARANGGSGMVTSILAISSWGSTQSYVLRIWKKQPSASTTCTDGASFVSNLADDFNLIGAGPTTITFSAPGSTVGDAKTYASLTGITWDYKNSDGTPSQNLYACLVTMGSDTPGASASLGLSLSGPQN